MKTSTKKLIWVVILTFLIAPVFVIFIDILSGALTPEFSNKLFKHWSLYTFVTPFVIFGPIIIYSFVSGIIKAIEKKNYKKAVDKYPKIIFTFIVIAIAYGLTSPIIGTLAGTTPEETRLGTINAVIYILVANIPFFLKFLQYLDEIYTDVPKNETKIFRLKTKFRITTLISSIAGVGLLCSSAYALAWRMVEFPEMNIDPRGFIQRMMIIGLIIVLLQSAPNFILGNIFTNYISKLKEVMLSVSKKNLTHRINIPSRDEFGLMSDSLETLRENLRSVVEKIKSYSSQLSVSGQSLSKMSTSLSDDSNLQASNAEEIAASVEEIASNINLSYENAESSSKFSLEAKNLMVDGKASVDQTLQDISNIFEKVQYIGEIADQTNLLAINAYVESSNAGTYGKSFGIIAREVRDLADRTKSSATSIIELVSKSLENSKISQEKITEIVPHIEKVSTLSGEIANSSKEQRAGSEQINESIQSFNVSSQRIASSSEALQFASTDLQNKSKELDQTVREFVV